MVININYLFLPINNFKMKDKLKIIGQNFLQPHPGMERLAGVYDPYVIVERDHLEQVIKFFEENPQYIEELEK